MASIAELLAEVGFELDRACAKHAPMHSAHEGYAVILEELDELWDEVKAQRPDPVAMRKEALQVAAMAIRFVRDVLGGAASDPTPDQKLAAMIGDDGGPDA